MTSTNGGKDGGNLAEDIAARAGLPHGESFEQSLHDIREGVLGQPGNAQSRTARDPYDDVRGSAEAARRGAEDRASDLADRAGRTADDVRGRVRDTYEDVRDRAAGAYDDAREWASDRYDAQRRRASAYADRGYARYNQGRAVASDFVSENPLVVGVIGLAAGLLLGALLPRTRQETEALGPWADEARDHGLRYAREATQQGRRFVERALDTDNLDAAVRDASDSSERPYEGPERTAHRL